jgi:hypothetical protein
LDIEVWQDFLLICDQAALSIFDITKRTQPVLIDQFNVIEDPSRAHLFDLFISPATETGFLMGWNSPLHVINLSDPLNIEILQIYAEYASNKVETYSDKKYLFVAKGTEGLGIIDIANLTEPRELYQSNKDIGRAYRVHLDGTKLYLVDFEGVIHIFEIQDN